MKTATPYPAGNTLSWNIDNRCGINGNSLSIKLYTPAAKEWVCSFATTAAADLIAYCSINAGNATNLFVKMDWKVTSTSTTDYGQVGYSTDDGQTFTWLTYGGINGTAVNNSGTYTYDYFIKDQVGNVRVRFNASSTGALVLAQMDDYYPMGNSFNSFTQTNKNNYLFNGMAGRKRINRT